VKLSPCDVGSETCANSALIEPPPLFVEIPVVNEVS
jgi:hypothetical protein